MYSDYIIILHMMCIGTMENEIEIIFYNKESKINQGKKRDALNHLACYLNALIS